MNPESNQSDAYPPAKIARKVELLGVAKQLIGWKRSATNNTPMPKYDARFKWLLNKSGIALPLVCRSGFIPRYFISVLCKSTLSRGKPAPTLTYYSSLIKFGHLICE